MRANKASFRPAQILFKASSNFRASRESAPELTHYRRHSWPPRTRASCATKKTTRPESGLSPPSEPQAQAEAQTVAGSWKLGARCFECEAWSSKCGLLARHWDRVFCVHFPQTTALSSSPVSPWQDKELNELSKSMLHNEAQKLSQMEPADKLEP